MTMRLDIVTNDSGELVRREHARDLGASVVIAIYRVAKLAQVHDLQNQAFTRQLEQTHQMIGEYCLRSGTNVSILFAHKAVFVAGQLLKGSRSTYEAASELGEIFERLGGSDLYLQRDVTREELYAFAEQISVGFRSAPGSFRSPTPKIRLRPVTDAARLRGLELEQLTDDERIVRTYASAVVIMRRFFEDLQASRYILPRRIKRIAQSLVDLSEGSTPAFLGVTEVRNANFDEAGRAANSAILAVSMAREVTTERVTLAQIAMAAMMHDVARPRALALAGASGPAMPGMQAPTTLSEDQEDRLAAGSAAVLTALGRLNEPSITRTVLTFESLWLRRQTWLGPVYWGARAPTLHAKMIAIARRYNDLLTPEPGLLPPTPDYAVAQLAEELKEPQDRLVLRMLVSALGLLPLGTVVQLNTGEIAEVVRGGKGATDKPRIRIVMDGQGGTVAQPVEVELGEDTRRVVSRVVSVDGWRKGLALRDDVAGGAADGGYVSESDKPAADAAAPPPPVIPAAMPLPSFGAAVAPSLAPSFAQGTAPPGGGASISNGPSARTGEGAFAAWGDAEGDAGGGRRESSSIQSGEHNSSQSLPSMGSSPSAVAEAMGRMINDSLRPPAIAPPDADREAIQPDAIGAAASGREPTARGNLATTPLPHVLVYMLDHGLTGSVVFEGAEGADTIHFVRGVPAKACLASSFAALGEVLVDVGALDQETVEHAVAASQQAGVLVGEYLVGAGVLEHDTIRWALEAQLLHRIAHLTNLPPDVTYGFYRDVDLLEGWGGGDVAISSALSPILASVRNWLDRARVRATLSRIGKHPLVLHEDADLSSLALTEPERAVLDAMASEPMVLPALTERGIADEEAVASLVYSLAVTRQFAFRGQKKGPMAPRGQLARAGSSENLPGGAIGAVSSSGVPVASGSVSVAASAPAPTFSQSRPAIPVAQPAASAAAGGSPGVTAQGASSASVPAARAPAPSAASHAPPPARQPSPSVAVPAAASPRPIAPAPRPAGAVGARPAPQIRPIGQKATNSAAPLANTSSTPAAPAKSTAAAPSSAPAPAASWPPKPVMTARKATAVGLQPAQPLEGRASTGAGPTPTPSQPPINVPAPSRPPPGPGGAGGGGADDEGFDEMKTIAFAPSDASKLVAALVAGKSPASLGLGSRPPGALRPAPELPSKIKSNAPARAGLPPPSTPPPALAPAPAAGPKPTASKAAALASPTSATAKQPASSLPTSPSAFDPQTARDIAFSDTDESPEADADVAAEAMTNFRLAEAALQRNDTAAALALAQKAAAGDPSQFDYVTLLAWVKALGGNPSAMEQSIKTLTRVLIEDPSNERALLYRGKLFARTSRLQEALNDFGDLVSANPEHREAQMELRLVKQRIG
jgi:hypothetical protein